MRIIPYSKPHSWLQLPVKMKGWDRPTLHLTIKYFGQAKVDPQVVRAKIGDRLSPASIHSLNYHRGIIEWEPTGFGVLCDVPVLKLTKHQLILTLAHEEFELIADDFSPWLPHITVQKDLWDFVVANKSTPIDMGLTFGGPELFIGSHHQVEGIKP